MFETSRFTVCALDTRREDVRLVWKDPHGEAFRGFARLQSTLGPDKARLRFAMNAGMFDEHGAPIGLFVENGRELVPANLRDGTGNFFLKPNGIFWVGKDNSLAVEPTDRYMAGHHDPIWATQSGPMLLVDGRLNPQIAPDGPSKFIRNGVGVRDPYTAYFAISDAPVSFGLMARFFHDVLGCRNALYLDGAVSSLWAPELGRRDDGHPLGPMVVVLGR